MQSGSPGGWRSLTAANHLVRDNQEGSNACLEAAARSKKEEGVALHDHRDSASSVKAGLYSSATSPQSCRVDDAGCRD